MKPPKLSPSVLFMSTFALGLSLSYLQPWHLTLSIDAEIMRMTGITILISCLLLNTLAYRAFKKALTPHAPFIKPKVLITNGVFSLSRNPVYLALVLSEFGLGFVFNTFWLLISAVVLWIVLDIVIVRAEEKILNSIFNEEYESYRKTTRRWF